MSWRERPCALPSSCLPLLPFPPGQSFCQHRTGGKGGGKPGSALILLGGGPGGKGASLLTSSHSAQGHSIRQWRPLGIKVLCPRETNYRGRDKDRPPTRRGSKKRGRGRDSSLQATARKKPRNPSRLPPVPAGLGVPRAGPQTCPPHGKESGRRLTRGGGSATSLPPSLSHLLERSMRTPEKSFSPRRNETTSASSMM